MGEELSLWDIYKELELLAYVHGWGTSVHTRSHDGSWPVTSVHFAEGRIYID